MKPFWLKKKYLTQKLRDLGLYDPTHWTRVVMYKECLDFLRQLGPENLEVLEISAGSTWKDNLNFKHYVPTHYPDYDVCEKPYPEKFDVVIADQVFTQLDYPLRAARHVKEMLKPGGFFIVTNCFLIKEVADPHDCTRWTEQGLECLLIEAGFAKDKIRTNSWGNRACVVANFNRWPSYGLGFFKSLRNESPFPVSVWAISQQNVT